MNGATHLFSRVKTPLTGMLILIWMGCATPPKPDDREMAPDPPLVDPVEEAVRYEPVPIEPREWAGPLELNETQLSFIARRMEYSGPAWESLYPRTSDDTHLMTEADVVGPDGLIYPDFRYAGVPGGIPDVPVVARASDFGAHADSGVSATDALEAAIAEVARQGGGAIELDAGVYVLDRPLVIRDNGIILRGAGSDRTTIRFTYHGPQPARAGFANAEDGNHVAPGDQLVTHHQTAGLTHMRLLGPDGATVAEHGESLPEWYFYPEYDRPANFTLEVRGRELIGCYGVGTHRFTSESVYGEETESATLSLTLSEEPDGPRVRRWSPSVFTIAGAGTHGQPRTQLARSAARGDRVIEVSNAGIFRDAEYAVLSVRGPETWYQQYWVEHAVARGGWARRVIVGVERVEGDRVYLKQPLRIPFSADDGVLVIPWQPTKQVGIEGLTIEQTSSFWISGISFRAAAESWVRDVRVIRPGRNPIDTWDVKHLEVRDAKFDGAIYTRGGGGTAYVAWQAAYDCLMKNVTARKLRHAPNVQWSSSGNVFLDSTFEDSGGQWHAGFATENLYENLTIRTTGAEGSYSFGLFSSIPSGMHGPQGPRNVVYGCRIDSWRGGVKLGGLNEGWIFAYNHVIARGAPALAILPGSMNLTFLNNVFVASRPAPSLTWIATPDIYGLWFDGNTFSGTDGQPLFTGAGNPVTLYGSTIIEAFDADLPAPTPPASLWAWQQQLPRDATQPDEE